MAKVTLRVEGMACESCSSKVRDALSAVPGVSAADADHSKGTAKVVHDGSVSIEDLLAAVIDAGFKAKAKTGLFG
ncbi:MAG: cation transporter [Candidatus Methanoplasma sp.]|jgi:copper chaperone CopZ|nr:cation transporter [Candidatus Methanoplasma sp.]